MNIVSCWFFLTIFRFCCVGSTLDKDQIGLVHWMSCMIRDNEGRGLNDLVFFVLFSVILELWKFDVNNFFMKFHFVHIEGSQLYPLNRDARFFRFLYSKIRVMNQTEQNPTINAIIHSTEMLERVSCISQMWYNEIPIKK